MHGHGRPSTSQNRPALTSVVLCTLLFLGGRSAAAQWAILSGQEQLRGKTIVDVGELSLESRYVVGSSSATSYQSGRLVSWYQFRGQRTVCADEFAFSKSSSHAALLLADEKGSLYLALLDTSIGSISVDVKTFVAIRCPSPY